MTVFAPPIESSEIIAENFMLLFGTELATVKTREQLKLTLNSWLKEVLKFDHTSVFLVGGQGKCLYNFLPGNHHNNGCNPFILNYTGKSIDEPVYSNKPHSNPHPPDVFALVDPLWLTHFEDGLIIALRDGEVITGYWTLLYRKDASPAREQEMLIRMVAIQLVLVTQKLISDETIAEREIESEIIQSLIVDFASIKDKKDLLKIIHFKLKKLFEFGHHWVAVINDDQLTMTSFLQDEQSKAKDHPKYQDVIKAKYTTNDRIFNQVLLSQEPSTFDLPQLSKISVLPEYMQILYETGVTKVVMTSLQVGSRIVGVWAICLVGNQIMNSRQLNLIKGIANQLSVAVDNIMINEELLRKETERELLLALSIDIGAVRNNNELLNVINNKFKGILGFTHTAILTIDNQRDKVKAFLKDPQSRSRNHPDYPELGIMSYSINDGFFDKVVGQSRPVVFDLDQLHHQINFPTYIKVNYDSGIKEAVVVRLAKGQEVFGFWLIFYEKPFNGRDNRLNMIESLANQISVAVLNIIANDEIQRKENEKSRLLAFSNAIASVNDKNKLAKILKQQLKELFNISEYGINGLNADNSKHTPILFDPDADFARHPDFRKLLGVETDVNDGIFNVIIASDEPVFFKLSDWNNLPVEPVYKKVLLAEGIKEMVGVSISIGTEKIAVMNFKHDDHVMIRQQHSLFKSILSQIAIMISNIMANEKINNQLKEISSYRQHLEEEKIYLKEEIETVHNYAELVGESVQMQKLFRMVAQVSHSDSTVLLLGETGTGKELVARAIHNNSPRRNKLMVKVNCAALPANLIESELFGHERGSFTGATERRLGKFELANGGTLFLDEIGEMPVDLQVKLLRALQEREIERIGGKGVIKVDVRIIAATNRNLEKEMEDGRFRRDLYYRLNIFPIELPTLRQRKEDIPLLATHFINRFAKKAGRRIKTISNKALLDMSLYDWPGNIRELEHLIERSILLTEGETLKTIYLPPQKTETNTVTEKKEFVIKSMDDNEREHIVSILKHCKGRVGGYRGAAELLDVPASTLFSKMKKLGIKRDIIE